MEFVRIKRAVTKENQRREKEVLDLIKKAQTVRELEQTYYYNSNITPAKREKDIATQKEFIIAKISKQFEKELAKNLEKIDRIANTTPTKSIKIFVDWKRSNTWGSNPTAEIWTDKQYIKGSSIGGCGYDKGSTATAQVLNSCDEVLHLLYKAFEKALAKNKEAKPNDVLNYGAGYGFMPYFEGGVGISCHTRILEKLGFNVEHHDSRSSDFIIAITK